MSEQSDFRLVVPHQGVEQVSARVNLPSEGEPRAVYVLAHGAGAPLDSEFLDALAPRISDAAGIAVLRFNYGYSELMLRSGTRRPPERLPALEVVHRAAHAKAREMFPDRPLIAGGKSLGGRVASLMVADGEPADALCFLGYPLHPPGKEDKLRTGHFPQLKTTALFLQGTRDALCNMELLPEALKLWAVEPTLHTVEGGDHSFSVLRRSGRAMDEVLDEMAGAVSEWAQQVTT